MSKQSALRFVLMIGVVSFFADFTYEGSRSIAGPYLAVLGASATVVGTVSGLGELLGYGLRLFSGRLSEKTGKFWPIILFGYFIQMVSVPLLAFVGSWPVASFLIVAERIGRAIRNPPRDVMLSHATKEVGYGWGFGLHEAMDQAGALVGPLVLALILSRKGRYQSAFLVLFAPAAVTLALLLLARFIYPRPEEMEQSTDDLRARGLPRTYWIYLAGAVLVAAGFADFSLIAFHFEKTGVVPQVSIPIFYAVAMGASGAGALLFGKLFDRLGMIVLVPLTVMSALSTPLVFLGGYGFALLGAAIWGLGMGVHESIIPAAVALIVPQQRRPSAYGTFTAAYGVFWFAGSALIGLLYDRLLAAVIVFSMVSELTAVPFFLIAGARVARQQRRTGVLPHLRD